MPLILVVLLVALPPITDPRLQEARAVLANELEQFGNLISNKYEELVDKPLIDTQIPQVGIVIKSSDVPDTDKRYPVIIVATYKDAPADKAGIRPGDRLVAIGKRRLDYETDVVVYNLLMGTGPIRLTTQRNIVITEHTVERSILPCIARAEASVNRTVMRERLDFIHRVHTLLLEQLQTAGDDLMALNKIGENNAGLAQLIMQMNVRLYNDLNLAVGRECQVQYTDTDQ